MISLHMSKSLAAIALTLAMLSGCKSRQDEAIEAAKKQAAATGQAQQVSTTDKDGSVTTITVQPPAPGQTTQAVTTTVTPPPPVAANTPATAPGVAGQPTGPADSTGQPVGSTVPPGQPVIRPADVNIAAGTNLTIRINQHISVKSSHAGDPFDGEVVEPVVGANGQVIIPKGTPVGGIVEASHRRGHFKGASILELRLTTLTLNDVRYRLNTSDLTKTKKGKGKRSAALIGGGTGLGMLIGGVATGGVGLVVGGLAGAGAGTALGGLTGNRDLDIPSESIVHFKLADDLTVQPS